MASIYTIENFYTDPDYVRQEALNMEWFDKKGNHPGKRTNPIKDISVKNKIETEINRTIIDWDADWNTYSGVFNLCTQQDRCWIHSDWGTTWACVIYLTPDAPLSSGTGLYKHNKTGFRSPPKDKAFADEIAKDGLDFTAWEVTDVIGNVYNRAVVYEGHYYHSAVQYFGHSPEYCRLHQTFFFSTKEDS
jgi:hypothetical protein|tara:strand:+ start:25 stop:594 length:570 start_codon:yes stop_codon:yes gene_type:complete